MRKDVKLLGVGELTKKLTIAVHAASATAREKVEAAGGTLTLLKEPKVQEGAQAQGGPKQADETADVDEVDAPTSRRCSRDADRRGRDPTDEQEGEE